MQMRPERVTRVARVSKHIAPFYPETARLKGYIDRKTLTAVLLGADLGINAGRKTVEMAIHCHIAIVVHHIKRTAITAILHFRPCHIAVGNHIYGLARHALCLEIEPGVKMIAAQFPEIAAQKMRKAERRDKHLIRSLPLCSHNRQ